MTCHREHIEKSLDFVLTHPTIEEFEISLSAYNNYSFFRKFVPLREKFNRVRQNIKRFSICEQIDEICISHNSSFVERLQEFLEANHWIDRFALGYFADASSWDCFWMNENLQIKNFKLKKPVCTELKETERFLIEFERI